MARTGFNLLILTLLLVVCSSDLVAQEMIIPEGWSFGPRRLYYSGIDDKIFQHGSQSTVIGCKAENPSAYCSLSQRMSVKDYNGKRIRMTGYIRSEGRNDTAKMWVRVDDIGTGKTTDFDDMQNRPVTGNFDWIKCEIVFDAGSHSIIFFGFLVKGNGKIWVDNINFEIVDKTIPKTAVSLNKPLPQDYVIQLKQMSDSVSEIYPLNLDFEDVIYGGLKAAVEANLPRMDLHVHLPRTTGQSLEERYRLASKISKERNEVFGIVEEPGEGDLKTMSEIISSYRKAISKYPMYLGLKVSGAGWMNHYTQETLNLIDYVLADALILPYNGKTVDLQSAETVFPDAEAFMQKYVEYILKIFEEPVDVWSYPSYLPESLSERYNELWTETRMRTVIREAVRHNIAIEINSEAKIPSSEFIILAKSMGAKFVFGSDSGYDKAGDISWSLSMASMCGLTGNDFYKPKRKLDFK
ncbi:MAG TPA: hypothetical protein VHO46_04395 [Bacteroidales bacterium]|nr:hypothetical protein [Bacteroidales bacterium]